MKYKELTDDAKIEKYITNIEEDIELNQVREKKIEVMLENLLDKFKDFKDIRALRASNIDAMTKLLSLYTELPIKRAQLRKLIVDVLIKKKQVGIEANKSDKKSYTTIMDFLNALDEKNVFPIYSNNDDE